MNNNSLPGAIVQPSGYRLDSLQALRGLAALLVMLLHATQMTMSFAAQEDITRHGLVPIGSFGVDIFFVLSGVVIAMLITRNDANPQTPVGFAFRRAAKLLPTFWATLMLMALLPPEPFADTLLLLLSQPLTFVLLAPQSVHGPAWTLLYETHFYLVAAAALCFPSRARQLMLLWILLQVAGVTLASAGIIRGYFFLGPLSLELCAGFLVGLAAPRARMPMPAAAAIGAVVLVVLESLLFPQAGTGHANPLRLALYGLPAALLVYALLSLERTGWKPPQLAVKLGEISYSLYMWHIPVMLLLAALLLPLRDWPLATPVYAILSVTLSIYAASAAYKVIEAPATEWATRISRRTKPRQGLAQA